MTDGAKTKKKAKKKVKKKAKKIQCGKCEGLCCRYFALPIEDPEDWDDFDDIRWYLCHENIDVFVEDGDWYMNVRNKCKYLSEKNYKCDMYEKRPKICRGYKIADCDYTSDDYGHELQFKSDRQMEEYMKIKFGNKVLDKLNPKKKKRKAKGKRQKA